jgi:hypothetical protein
MRHRGWRDLWWGHGGPLRVLFLWSGDESPKDAPPCASGGTAVAVRDPDVEVGILRAPRDTHQTATVTDFEQPFALKPDYRAHGDVSRGGADTTADGAPISTSPAAALRAVRRSLGAAVDGCAFPEYLAIQRQLPRGGIGPLSEHNCLVRHLLQRIRRHLTNIAVRRRDPRGRHSQLLGHGQRRSRCHGGDKHKAHSSSSVSPPGTTQKLPTSLAGHCSKPSIVSGLRKRSVKTTTIGPDSAISRALRGCPSSVGQPPLAGGKCASFQRNACVPRSGGPKGRLASSQGRKALVAGPQYPVSPEATVFVVKHFAAVSAATVGAL